MSSPAFAAVCAALRRAGGWLPFDEYLDIVQNDPRAGFYGSGRVQFGIGGDFATAPHISPLFGKMVARQTAEILRATGGNVLELGAGDGRLAAQILDELENLESSDKADGAGNLGKVRYLILEPSAALQHRQRQTLRGRQNVEWCGGLPDSFCGVILANEVLDAVPFLVFAKRGGAWFSRGVAEENGALQWAERPAAKSEWTRRLDEMNVPDGYITEINPRAEALAAALCEKLQAGALLVADYGFGRREYYHPQRTTGTLMCHRAGRADAEPLECPGDKDITAHMDFTAVAEAGIRGGAKLAGYAAMAQFLINCGIAETLRENAKNLGVAEYAKLAAGAQKLLAPQEMGELFKVMAFIKGNMPPLTGFSAGDAMRRL